MRQQVTVYFEDVNRHWLQNIREETGIGVSTLVNTIVSEKRKANPNYISEANRSLENARVADLEQTGE